MSTDNRIELRMEDLERRVAALEQSRRDSLWGNADAVAGCKEQLIARYGEHVDKTLAARIIGVTRATIYAMLADGRIKGSCGGKRVSVKSIAAYLCAQKQEELA